MVTHVVDGASAASHLGSILEGTTLDWLDVLHDGPVRGTLDREERTRERARFIASMGWDEEEEAYRRLNQRYTQLAQAEGEIVLWFAAELFDQLQLLEILNWLFENPAKRQVSLVETATSIPLLDGATIRELWEQRQPLTDQQLDLAQRAWAAFTEEQPEQLAALAELDTSALPFLGQALTRLNQEYPAPRDGLTLTQRHILDILAQTPLKPGALFKAVQQREPVPFMGDASFWGCLGDLASGEQPLLTSADGYVTPTYPIPGTDFLGQLLILTEAGKEVQTGRERWQGRIPRWLGGAYL